MARPPRTSSSRLTGMVLRRRAQQLGVGASLAGHRPQRGHEGVEVVFGLGLGRLHHQGFFDDQRK